jgi:hypothetical protein
LYWDYVDAYLFVPEVAFAVNLKNRLIWKPGFTLEANERAVNQFMRNWKRLKLYRVLKYATKNALIWGNAWLELVDNSEAKWGYGSPAGTALGAGDPRPLLKWKPATEFYGLKQIDPRTMRVFINPNKFDTENAEPLVLKYVQRRWAGPLGPTPETILAQGNVEIDFHRDQIFHLPFNKLPGGIYGYSMYRSTIYALKGYCIMLQYLPAIVQKRADPLLHLKLGGRIVGEDGRERDYLPSDADLLKWKSELQNRQGGEDIFSDMLTTVNEVYQSSGSIKGVSEYISAWKERILVGLGIPASLFDIIRAGSEVKWGELKFEILEDEIREYQEDLEDKINELIVPRLCSGEAEFHFNPITPEDWRSNVEPLLDLFKAKVVSAEYVVDRLNMPENARTGTMYEPQASPFTAKPKPVEQPVEKRRERKPSKFKVKRNKGEIEIVEE